MTWCVATVFKSSTLRSSWAVQSACNLKLRGVKDELKHVDRSLRQISPEYKQVLYL